jgi:hypothetical protein
MASGENGRHARSIDEGIGGVIRSLIRKAIGAEERRNAHPISVHLCDPVHRMATFEDGQSA